jgi:arylsulfatase A-like enzyme
MNSITGRACLVALSVLIARLDAIAADARKPNIVVIVADDLGYADVRFNPLHPSEVGTPHLDALARKSVICRQGYVSGHVCSPTRAGLMTGRYQQRLGLYTGGEAGSGLPKAEQIFPQFLALAGYKSIQLGKWHLGPDPDWSPALRGFDEVFGFLGRGAHDYFKLDDPDDPIYRGTKPVKLEGYLTDHFGSESVAFVERNKTQPFFMYLAFNAVHAPLQAPVDEIAKFQTGNKDRDTLLAMGKRMDDAIGGLVAKLKAENLWNNTLLFFISDNGGPLAQTANNSPLRAGKHSDYEGGIRVPFLVCWPDQLKPGESQAVVSSLDILPTALAAAGVSAPTDKKLDGLNLLPILRGDTPAESRDLFWSSGGEEGWWAVRSGDWKLVGDKGKVGLFDLSKDVSEAKDLAKQMPAQVESLTNLHDVWLAEMAEPVKGGGKKWGVVSKVPPKKKRTEAEKEQDRAKKRMLRKHKDSDTSTSSANPTELNSGNTRSNTEQPDNLKGKTAAPVADQLAAFPPAATIKRPNVLFVICDDLGCRIGPTGYQGVSTPVLEKLASQSTVFPRAYCQYPVCGPSRASFLSGLYPQATGILDNKSNIADIRPGTMSLPRAFRQEGYWTASAGKVFHNPADNPGNDTWDKAIAFENEETAIERAARVAFEKEHGPITNGSARKAWREHLLTVAPQTRNQGVKGVGPGYGSTGLRDEQHSDGKNARQVASWITDREHGDRPFFIACGFHKPHIPFLAPDAYFEKYPIDSIALTRSPTNDWHDIPTIAATRQYLDYGFPPLGQEDDTRRRAFMQAYYACVSFVDAQLGIIVDALHQTGEWENTVIVFIGDHGYNLGEHHMWGKVLLFEESARVPLIVRVPGVSKGGIANGLVELVDLFPTLADLCKVSRPDNLQGRSFASMIDDPLAAGKEYAYTVVQRGEQLGRAIRFDRWRYTAWGTPAVAELYDLLSDPNEFNNLASDEKLEEVRVRARRLLDQAHEATR